MRAALAAWIVCIVARVAAAEPTIILAETRGSPVLPSLPSQLELHASATVQRLDVHDADPLTFAAQASQLVARGDAALVVWIAPVDTGFLVFASGGWPGRALIELVRIDRAMEPAEIERTIALKIAGLLDSVLAPRATAQAALAVPPSAVPRPAWRVDVIGAVAREKRQRHFDGRAGVAVSRRFDLGPWFVAPVLAAYWQPSGVIDGEHGSASVTELGAAIALDAGRRLGPIEVFARPRYAFALLFARGTSTDGRRGDATLGAPYLGGEAGLRIPITDILAIGGSVGADYALIRHKLLIDNETVVDLGRFRLHVGAMLEVTL